MTDIIISDVGIAQRGKIVQYMRADGFAVFLDGDKELDKIRLKEDKKTVIACVSIRRCQQIARNYATKHAPELISNFQIENRSLRKLLKGKNTS